MAGSSMRNSLHRRNHKERSQLAGRERLGLLEKHKDYVLRARDYSSKKARVKRLQEKASMRNKDEFYFGMVNKKTEKGVQYESRGNVAMANELVKVLKTQDVGYVRTVRASEQSNIERLKAQLGSLADLVPAATATRPGEETELDEKIRALEESTLASSGLVAEKSVKGKGKGKVVPRKIVFRDTLEEVHNYAPSALSSSASSSSTPLASSSSSTAPDLGWLIPLTKATKKKAKQTAQLDPVALAEEKQEEEKSRVIAAKRHKLTLLRNLSTHLVRESALKHAEHEMNLQRNLMGKGSKKKLSAAGREEIVELDGDEEEDDERGGKKGEWKSRVFKWKAERSR